MPTAVFAANETPSVYRRRGWIVGLLFVAIMLNYVDRGNLSVAAVPMMEELQVSTSAMGTLLSAFFWSYALLQIPAGYLVDRFSLAWTYAGAFLLWSAASTAIGLANTFIAIFTMRLLLGVGESLAVPATFAFIHRHFTPEERGLPSGLCVSGMTIGPAVGTLVGGFFLESWDWRSLFLWTGLGGCLWLLPWLLVAPRVERAARATSGGMDALPATSFSWRRLLACRAIWGISLGTFGYSYYWYFFLTWMPSYLVGQRDLSYGNMGVYTAAPLLVMSVLSPLSGRLADWLTLGEPGKLFVRKAFTCGGFALASVVILVPFATTPAILLTVLLSSMAGLGFASANFWAITQSACPAAAAGRVVGYQNTVANLAGVCAPVLTGWLVQATGTFDLPLFLSGASLWIAVAAYVLLVRESDIEAFHATVRPPARVEAF